jgi:hypothetical protein
VLSPNTLVTARGLKLYNPFFEFADEQIIKKIKAEPGLLSHSYDLQSVETGEFVKQTILKPNRGNRSTISIITLTKL